MLSGGLAQTLRIQLNADVAAGDVVVQFDRDGPTTSGLPPARVACTDASDVTIIDVLRVIQSCAAADSPVSMADDVVFNNPGGNTNVLQISWLGPASPCSYEIRLTQPEDRYTVDINAMGDTCGQARVVRTVNLQLTKPIEPWEITGWSDQVAPPPTGEPIATPTGHELSCDNDMALLDGTGLLASCDLQTDVSVLPPWGGYPRSLRQLFGRFALCPGGRSCTG